MLEAHEIKNLAPIVTYHRGEDGDTITRELRLVASIKRAEGVPIEFVEQETLHMIQNILYGDLEEELQMLGDRTFDALRSLKGYPEINSQYVDSIMKDFQALIKKVKL